MTNKINLIVSSICFILLMFVLCIVARPMFFDERYDDHPNVALGASGDEYDPAASETYSFGKMPSSKQIVTKAGVVSIVEHKIADEVPVTMVESVVDYVVTRDATPQPGKIYFTKAGDDYYPHESLTSFTSGETYYDLVTTITPNDKVWTTVRIKDNSDLIVKMPDTRTVDDLYYTKSRQMMLILAFEGTDISTVSLTWNRNGNTITKALINGYEDRELINGTNIVYLTEIAPNNYLLQTSEMKVYNFGENE